MRNRFHRDRNELVTETQAQSTPISTPTLAEVAARAGVSKATASRALSGSPAARVDPATASRVKLAAEELNYVPNPHAQALARATSPSVGLLIHEISNPFFSEIASGVLTAAARHDRMVMICNTRRDPEQELRYIAEMRAMRVHVLLVAGSEFADPDVQVRLEEELDAYRAIGGRVALMRPHPGGTVVIPDTDLGARLAAEHLLSLGHRQIGILSGPEQLAGIRERMRAFADRLADDGVAPALVVPGEFSRDGGHQATREMMQSDPTITAIFALNDLMAAGAVHAARELGLAVPDDLSIVGFDDLPIASDVSPPLTTVRLPLREMGERALDVALSDEARPVEPVILAVELVERASSAPVRRGARI